MAAVFVVYQSPLGPIKITAESSGITELKLQFGKNFSSTEGIKQETGNPLSLEHIKSFRKSDSCCQHLDDCVTWLNVYFMGEFDKLKITKFPQLKTNESSSFNIKIWNCLSTIQAGQTISYGELADLAVGNRRAARAVGNAVRSHHLPLLIPCHRVVKTGGAGLGNYSGGDGCRTKEWLLKHENCI